MQIQHPWPQLLNFEPTRIPASRLPLLSTTPKQEGSVKVKRHCTAVLTFSLCKSSCKCSWIRSELRPRTFKASLTSFSSFLRHVCERLENVHFCLFMRLAYKRILASDGLDIPDFLFWRQQLARVTWTLPLTPLPFAALLEDSVKGGLDADLEGLAETIQLGNYGIAVAFVISDESV